MTAAGSRVDSKPREGDNGGLIVVVAAVDRFE